LHGLDQRDIGNDEMDSRMRNRALLLSGGG